MRLLIGLMCFMLVSGSVRAESVTIEGVSFVRERIEEGARLKLVGTALLRYRVVFRAYVGALYLGEGVRPDRVLEDVPKRLELEYFWGIKGEDFVTASEPFLKDNVDEETLKAITDRLETLNGWYRDVSPGDRYALTYIPGRGTELAWNDEPLGVVEGADFAAAYFSIWVGERPLDDRFKRRLLSGGR